MKKDGLFVVALLSLLFCTLFVDATGNHSSPGERKRRSLKNWVLTEKWTPWTLYPAQEDGQRIQQVPYVVLPFEGEDLSSYVEEATRDIHKYTCVRFVTRQSNHHRYVTIRFRRNYNSNGKGRAYNVGMGADGNKVRINLSYNNPYPVATITHELLHVLGLLHEQDRPEAPLVAKLLWKEDFFKLNSMKQTVRAMGEMSPPRTNYDVTSILQYPGHWLLADGTYMYKSSQRISYQDILAINRIYQCPSALSSSLQEAPRRCRNGSLPEVDGNGVVDGGNRREWMEMEAVRLVCDQGWIPDGVAFSHCQEGIFTPRRLKCKPRCHDQLPSCTSDFCESPFKRNSVCKRTCGTCDERAECPLPTIFGNGVLEIYGDIVDGGVKNGTIVQVRCAPGWVPVSTSLALCGDDGNFGVRNFYCTPELIPKSNLCNRFESSVNDVDCGKIYPKLCSRSEIEVEGEGRLVPKRRQLFQLGETVQLVCDEGYEPSSGSVATCVHDEGLGRASFLHHKFKCVESKRCEDERGDEECKLYAEVEGRCNETEAETSPCRKTCGLCECRQPLAVDRAILLPFQNIYKHGQSVRLNCPPDSRAKRRVEISTCKHGQWTNRNLGCVLVRGSSCRPPKVGGGRRPAELFPNLQRYENNALVRVRCLGKRYASADEYEMLQCTDGKFNSLRCPRVKRGSCSRAQLRDDAERLGFVVPDALTSDGDVTLQAEARCVYVDEERVTVRCDRSGNWMYDRQCSSSKPSAASCNASSVPRVWGSGKFVPVKDSYADGEVIEVTCDQGHNSVANNVAVCDNGTFVSDTHQAPFDFTVCYQEECSDRRTECNKDVDCSDTRYQMECQFSCGSCELKPCVADGLGYALEADRIGDKLYRSGHTVRVTCPGYFSPPSIDIPPEVRNITCMDGRWSEAEEFCPFADAFHKVKSLPLGAKLRRLCESLKVDVWPFRSKFEASERHFLESWCS